MEASLLRILRQNFLSNSERQRVLKHVIAVSAVICVIAAPRFSEAATPPRPKLSLVPKRNGPYELLESKALAIENKNKIDGWGYIISGGAVLAISIPAYYLSSDVFAQVVYSVGQTLGVGAITYGSSLVLVDNEYTTFYHIIKSDPTLTQDNKETLATSFLQETGEKARQGRKIRFVFHSLTATLNFLNGATTSNSDLRATLYFLGGINTLAAINYLVRPSEEEKVAETLQLNSSHSTHITFEPMIGPIVGLQAHW